MRRERGKPCTHSDHPATTPRDAHLCGGNDGNRNLAAITAEARPKIPARCAPSHSQQRQGRSRDDHRPRRRTTPRPARRDPARCAFARWERRKPQTRSDHPATTPRDAHLRGGNDGIRTLAAITGGASPKIPARCGPSHPQQRKRRSRDDHRPRRRTTRPAAKIPARDAHQRSPNDGNRALAAIPHHAPREISTPAAGTTTTELSRRSPTPTRRPQDPREMRTRAAGTTEIARS